MRHDPSICRQTEYRLALPHTRCWRGKVRRLSLCYDRLLASEVEEIAEGTVILQAFGQEQEGAVAAFVVPLLHPPHGLPDPGGDEFLFALFRHGMLVHIPAYAGLQRRAGAVVENDPAVVRGQEGIDRSTGFGKQA